ncbi:MAG TPA: hypothetical protein VGB39_02180 [Sphingomicrobium sp.]
MRAAASPLAMLAALAGCNEAPRQAETNNAAVTDVEALPPDESVETSSDELANGATEPVNGEAAQE